MKVWAGCLAMMVAVASAQRPVPVPSAPSADAHEQAFRDAKFGVRFRIPPGWSLNRKDGQVSTFRLDARTARPKSEMRSVASLEFNPFPMTNLSGAMLYFSVERHAHEGECVQQTATPDQPPQASNPSKDVVDIGGMNFVHGHDEHGGICIEARDEIYTAYRKGTCYRFDLEMNTFCSESSGAQEMTDSQIQDIESRMAGILFTVKLDWQKSGPTVVPPPEGQRKLLTPPPPDPPKSTKGTTASF